MKKNIVHFITSLDTGGAEMMLFKLLSAVDRDKCNHLVVSLIDKGTIGSRIEELGIRVFELNLSRKSPVTSNFIKLWSVLRQFNPDVFQGWMYHANFLSYLVSLAYPRVDVCWGVRQTLYNIKNEKFITRSIIYLSKYLSYRCKKVVFNSSKSLEQHIEYGFSSDNCCVIPNGFDAESFSLSKFSNKYSQIRSALDVPDNAVLIGIVSRYHPMKGYKNFIEAALKVLEVYPDVHFIAVGNGVTDASLGYLIEDQFKCSFHLLGEKHNISELLSVFDIAVNSSAWGEAFSNSVCEAMAMEIPCVVTDVGDSGFIVGNYGIVVKPDNVDSLASGLITMIEKGAEERNHLGKKSRQRIVSNFSLDNLKQKYESLYNI